RPNGCRVRVVARGARHPSARFTIASRLQQPITCVVDLQTVVRGGVGAIEIELIIGQRLSGAKGECTAAGAPQGIGNALRLRFQMTLEADFELALGGDSRRIQNIAFARTRAMRLRWT